MGSGEVDEMMESRSEGKRQRQEWAKGGRRDKGQKKEKRRRCEERSKEQGQRSGGRQQKKEKIWIK